MLNKIIDWYIGSGVVRFFFWGPLVINAVFYPIHTWFRVQRDFKKKGESYYHEYVTVGDLIKYVFITILPVVNCLATVFHVLPKTWEYLCIKFARLFNIRLIDGKQN